MVVTLPKTVLVEPAQSDLFEAEVIAFAPSGVFVRADRVLPFRAQARLTFAPDGQEPISLTVEVVSASAAGTAFELLGANDPRARGQLAAWASAPRIPAPPSKAPKPPKTLPVPLDLVRDLV
ncbi:MAG: hypothetical protein U1E65_22290 [Myxococcota bacterium]